MFQIPKETMNRLAKSREEFFYKRVAASLRKDFPSLVQDMSDSLLRDQIIYLHKKAEKYGIKIERDVFKFICLGIIAGTDFDKQPPIHAVLANERFLPQEKIDILLYALEQKEKYL